MNDRYNAREGSKDDLRKTRNLDCRNATTRYSSVDDGKTKQKRDVDPTNLSREAYEGCVFGEVARPFDD